MGENGNGNGNGLKRTQIAVAFITVVIPLLGLSIGWNFHSITDNQREIAQLAEHVRGIERGIEAFQKEDQDWKRDEKIYDKEVRDQLTRIYDALTDVRVKLGSFPEEGASNGGKRK